MKTTTPDFMKWLAKVRRASRDGKADRALSEVNKMLKIWPEHPRLLLLKATLIQLSENGSLAEAKRTLKQVVAANKSSPEPLIELGYFFLNVEDRAKQAEPIFDRAIESSFRLLLEAVRGKVEAMSERSVNDFNVHELIDIEGAVYHCRVFLNRYTANGARNLQDGFLELTKRIHDLLSGRNGQGPKA